MANEVHLKILKQGVEAWNKWREKNPTIRANLYEANLYEANLNKANLSFANLSFANLSFAIVSEANLSFANLRGAAITGADLSKANLSDANLSDVYLNEANLIGANLSKANLSDRNLSEANLSEAYLRGANLSKARLNKTNLSFANLSEANLSEAYISEANLSEANLHFTNFSSALLLDAGFANAKLGQTIFANTDLSRVNGLDSVKHDGSSTIGIDTLYISKGRIPEAFLRGCGLSDWEIESAKLYNPDLSNEEINNIYYRIHDLRVSRAFQINPLFISYSHRDDSFVDAIDRQLTQKGIRFWRDIHHAKAGRLEKQIDRAIHLNDVVLLVLSEHSTNSDWVEHEARKAREKEKSTGKDALCPVALDGSWKTCRWPERLREQIMEYNILDFSNWQDAANFQKMFGKLLEGLNLFYK